MTQKPHYALDYQRLLKQHGLLASIVHHSFLRGGVGQIHPTFLL